MIHYHLKDALLYSKGNYFGIFCYARSFLFFSFREMFPAMTAQNDNKTSKCPIVPSMLALARDATAYRCVTRRGRASKHPHARQHVPVSNDVEICVPGGMLRNRNATC